ncbi:hypothetical protein HanRHA438_Chr07g0319041 [Helianthus annuus]|nr:hypothetical protein HanRHA438_Chr07g0319041 [Helianthus annuus]
MCIVIGNKCHILNLNTSNSLFLVRYRKGCLCLTRIRIMFQLGILPLYNQSIWDYCGYE